MSLSSSSMIPTSSTATSVTPQLQHSSPSEYAIVDAVDEQQSRLSAYLHRLSGSFESEVDVIVKDHSYARPWNWRPENIYVKPVKKLFFPKAQCCVTKDIRRPEEDVDVEGGIEEPQTPPFDLTRSKHAMEEFQRLAHFAKPEENDDWEEKIEKTLWSPVQTRIFTKVVRILTSERLSRLARTNNAAEPLYRRTSIDYTAKSYRETLASIGWDPRLTQWLHGLLFDHLPQEYLSIYLDVLQTLRSKIPQLIDKMIAVQPNINAKGGPITWETLGSLLKRSWDPMASSFNSNRPKKLPGNPILIIAPSGVGTTISSRQHKWISHLGALGMVVGVHTHLGLAANRMTMMVCMDQLVQATRAKIQDVRGDCPGRPIILVGFNTGSALACQVAQMEHVTAVICLGFPFTTVEGKRGTPDDTLMDVRCPVMFVIGQNATLVRTDDLEDVRERMLVETGLVVVGTADDHLRISTAKKMSEGITQSMVDRCILDEIGDFVGSILLQPHPLPLRPASMLHYENRKNTGNNVNNSGNTNNKEPLKRKNSTSSSVESEPNSPIIKKSRPGTPIATNAPVPAGTPPARTQTGLSNQQCAMNASSASLTPLTTARRKNRVVGGQKINFSEHIASPRFPGQSSPTGSSGITLNIGSLASLGPIGPIRLGPSSINQPITTNKSGCKPSTMSMGKMSKIMPSSSSSSMSPQSSSKIKTVLPSSKILGKMLSNYEHINIIEKNAAETNVLQGTTVAGHVKPATTTTPVANKSSGSNGGFLGTIQNGKLSSNFSGGSMTSARSSMSSSNMLLNSTGSAMTVNTPTSSKVMDSIATSGGIPSCIRTLDGTTTKISMISSPSNLPASSSNHHPLNTSCGNLLMFPESNRQKAATTSFGNHPHSNSLSSVTILPISNKSKTLDKSLKTVPKITMNNIQRNPITTSVSRSTKCQQLVNKSLTNDLDDEDFGNILDIPIIFAKHGENLNAIERNDIVPMMGPQTPVCSQPEQPPMATLEYEKPTTVTKLNPATTKVVLISNKSDKTQPPGKLIRPAIQNLTRPSSSNMLLQQARPQTHLLHHQHHQHLPHPHPHPHPAAPIPKITRPGFPLANPRPSMGNQQPTVKYTKIILSKRQPNAGDKSSEQVVLTKNPSKSSASSTSIPKIFAIDKNNEHRYAQVPPSKIAAKYPALSQDQFGKLNLEEGFEIEEAIKANVIERKRSIPEIDLTSSSSKKENEGTAEKMEIKDEVEAEQLPKTVFEN